MQYPIGFFAVWNALIAASTDLSTFICGPSKANEQRFFAAPNPPGIISASKSCTDSESSGLALPVCECVRVCVRE